MPGTWLTPEELSTLLWTEYRIRRSPRRLGQLRQLGSGPRFHRDGVVVRYAESTSRAWAEGQLGTGFTSTSQETAQRLVEARAQEIETATL